MPTFDTLRQEADDRGLVRKVQRAIAFLAPKSVDMPDTLMDPSGGLVDFKAAGWLPVGLVTPDGWSFARETDKEDIDALGYASSVRSDITKVERSVTFTALETGRLHMQELKYGTDLSAVEQDSTTGEIVIDEPDLPVNSEYRLLVIGSDGPADDNWILGKAFGSVKLAESGEETWGQEGAIETEYTLDIFTDAEVGVPTRHFLAGTGAVKKSAVLGFTQSV